VSPIFSKHCLLEAPTEVACRLDELDRRHLHFQQFIDDVAGEMLTKIDEERSAVIHENFDGSCMMEPAPLMNLLDFVESDCVYFLRSVDDDSNCLRVQHHLT
jgi:hypothetical protein